MVRKASVTVHSAHFGRMRGQLARFARDRTGASFIEYVIVVGLVAIIAITAFTEFGDKVVSKLTDETNALEKIKTK